MEVLVSKETVDLLINLKLITSFNCYDKFMKLRFRVCIRAQCQCSKTYHAEEKQACKEIVF